jgi:1,4-dihydroxy-2-naphthoate octaprenyltransferase
MTDDYFDYKHAVDHAKTGGKNPYTGGSGTLTSGLIHPKKMISVFIFLYLIVIILGLYLTYERGWPIIAFGLFGIFWSVFYTSPPIKFAHHGFGELGLLINFGPIIGLGAFYVQSQQLTFEAFLATLPCGIMLFSMIIINEIPDINEDKLAGKLTLVARFGKKTAIKLYILSWIITYCVLFFSILFSILPWPVIICFISFPLVIDSILKIVRTNEQDEKLFSANKRMIQSHGLTSFAIIFGYLWDGYLNGQIIFEIIPFFILIILLYIPSLIPPIQMKKEEKSVINV